MDAVSISAYRLQFEKELFDNVLPFWVKHSPDEEYGGYFNALSRDGSRYDGSKYIWLQARQVWMFSTLWLKVAQKEEWKHIATLGYDFLKEHAVHEESNRAYFSLTRDGEPLWMQRKIFSECFIIMAFAQYSRVIGDEVLLTRAKELFNKVLQWSQDLTQIGRPHYSGAAGVQTLAIPMILLNVIEELSADDWRDYRETAEECIRKALMHVDHDRQVVLENVRADSSNSSGTRHDRSFENGKKTVFMDDTIDGRLLNPGHAIEAGWFIQHWAQKLNRQELSVTAVNMVRWSLTKGWDEEHGGIYYFLDSMGFSPVQLEWDMKLWWPHTEAMYACLLNYSLTKDAQDWAAFEKVTAYAFGHFPDKEYGEWFGYLNRRGEITHNFKGGPYKGCFHVPRSLWMCWRLLSELEMAFASETAATTSTMTTSTPAAIVN